VAAGAGGAVVLKTSKASAEPDYADKKARVEQLYAIADGEAASGSGDPEVVFNVA
jgi:hypothetical protein